MLLTARERKEVACPVDDMYSSICMYVYICVCVYAEQCSPLFFDGDVGSWLWQRTLLCNGRLSTRHTRTRTSAVVVGVPLARSRLPYAEDYTISN
jgi:hypothetical protein